MNRISTTKIAVIVGCLCVVLACLGVAISELGMVEADHPVAMMHQAVYAHVTGRGAYTRESTIQCMLRYVDGLRETKDNRGRTVYILSPSSRDGCIDEHEIDNAKGAYLSTFERKVSWVKTNSRIMADCDFDMTEEDRLGLPHCISERDMQQSNKTCLATADKLEKMDTYICRRAYPKFKNVE